METYKKMTVNDLVQQFMLEADSRHMESRNAQSTGFVIYPQGDGKTGCNFIYAGRVIRTLDALRRFGVAVRDMVKHYKGTHAGIMCDVPISLNGAQHQDSVVIYVDQKYGGLRVWTATKSPGSHLLFQDHGNAFPGTSLFPELFTAESYGPAETEA